MPKTKIDYSKAQIKTARQEFKHRILPMIRKRFPEISDKVASALTGSGSFGATDKTSDFDGSVFLTDEDYKKYGESLQKILLELPRGNWADVQDPGAHFSALSFRQMGIPISGKKGKQINLKDIPLISVWHFKKYITLYDPAGFLKQAKHIAESYPSEIIISKSKHFFSEAKEQLIIVNKSSDILEQWIALSDALCSMMRGALSSEGQVFPQEKWLWWYFSRVECQALRPLQVLIPRVAIPSDDWDKEAGKLILIIDNMAGKISKHKDKKEIFTLKDVWFDLWWQDNCLYHDIMRKNDVSAFIRTGRCLTRAVQVMYLMLSVPEGRRTFLLKDIKNLDKLGPCMASHIRYLCELKEPAKWRYQIGYLIEFLKDYAFANKLIPAKYIMKPVEWR